MPAKNLIHRIERLEHRVDALERQPAPALLEPLGTPALCDESSCLNLAGCRAAGRCIQRLQAVP